MDAADTAPAVHAASLDSSYGFAAFRGAPDARRTRPGPGAAAADIARLMHAEQVRQTTSTAVRAQKSP